MVSKHAKEILTKEQEALRELKKHLQRVKTLDEMNPKAITRAGGTGKAVRDLVESVDNYLKSKEDKPDE